MDKKYLEEQMSAYLDGELPPNEMAQYAQEIQAYPELFAELQTMERLNKLAKSAQLKLPDEKYFENLAGRIDESVAKQPSGQSGIVDFLLARRKSVAIISSAAAVLLIVLIGMNMFGPTATKYPSELPEYRTVPPAMVSPSRQVDTAMGAVMDLRMPPKVESSDTPKVQISTRDESLSEPEPQVTDEVVSIKLPQVQERESTPAVLTDGNAEKSPATSEARKVPPGMTIKPGEVKKRNLGGEATGIAPQSLSAFDALARTSDTVIIFTETILPAAGETYGDLASEPAGVAAAPDLSRFHDSDNLSWSVYLGVFSELEQGMYRSWKLSALTRSLDSLQAWKDSIKVLGPARWYAEQAFRSLQAKEITWDEYQRMRAYIDHYMAETQIPDSAVWNRRLPLVDEIYERQLGKQNRDKK